MKTRPYSNAQSAIIILTLPKTCRTLIRVSLFRFLHILFRTSNFMVRSLVELPSGKTFSTSVRNFIQPMPSGYTVLAAALRCLLLLVPQYVYITWNYKNIRGNFRRITHFGQHRYRWLIIHGGCVPANRRVKWEKHNNHHSDVKLATEFFDFKLIICITSPDKPGEGSTQLIGFKIWPRIGYWCSS
jgi:hypothetical protein